MVAPAVEPIPRVQPQSSPRGLPPTLDVRVSDYMDIRGRTVVLRNVSLSPDRQSLQGICRLTDTAKRVAVAVTSGASESGPRRPILGVVSERIGPSQRAGFEKWRFQVPTSQLIISEGAVFNLMVSSDGREDAATARIEIVRASPPADRPSTGGETAEDRRAKAAEAAWRRAEETRSIASKPSASTSAAPQAQPPAAHPSVNLPRTVWDSDATTSTDIDELRQLLAAAQRERRAIYEDRARIEGELREARSAAYLLEDQRLIQSGELMSAIDGMDRAQNECERLSTQLADALDTHDEAMRMLKAECASKIAEAEADFLAMAAESLGARSKPSGGRRCDKAA